MAQEASFYTCLEKAQQQNFNRYVRQGWQANYANILVRPCLSLAVIARRRSVPVCAWTSLAAARLHGGLIRSQFQQKQVQLECALSPEAWQGPDPSQAKAKPLTPALSRKFTADIFNLLACCHCQLNSQSASPAVLVTHWHSMLTRFQLSRQAR